MFLLHFPKEIKDKIGDKGKSSSIWNGFWYTKIISKISQTLHSIFKIDLWCFFLLPIKLLHWENVVTHLLLPFLLQ